MDGALLIHKPAGISSFGVIEAIQKELMGHRGVRRRDLPTLGHGGTLDPFATGLLVVCVGRGVKLARYFLSSTKTYEGVIRFGETTIPGDPTDPVSERSDRVPASQAEIQEVATQLTLQPYLQTPPMHSARKKNGKPLYCLARQGIDVEREPKVCFLHAFEILSYEAPMARFRLTCGSGTYVRTLAQDLGRLLGSVAMLDSLERTASGIFSVSRARTLAEILLSCRPGQSWDELSCWVPFHRLLDGLDRAQATPEEAAALLRGQQNVLLNILKRTEPAPSPPPSSSACQAAEDMRTQIAIYSAESLLAVASRQQGEWGLERVFATASGPMRKVRDQGLIR